MKKIFMYGALLCLLLAMYSPVNARQPQGNLPPLEIVEQSGDTRFAILVKDVNGVRRYMLQHDGTAATYNSSGATLWSVDKSGLILDGKVTGSDVATVSGVTGASGVSMQAYGSASGNSSYTLSTTYNHYIFTVSTGSYPAWGHPVDGSTAELRAVDGVSVYMVPGSEALDGYKVTISSHPNALYYSGTSEILFVPGNMLRGDGVSDWIVSTSLGGESGVTRSEGSGVTDVFAYGIINNENESVTFIYEWGDASGGTWWQIGQGN